MKKIHKFLKAIALIITKPYLLNLITESQEVFRKKVIQVHGMHHGLPQIKLNDLFPEFSENVEPYAFLEGSSLPVDIALLKSLARKFNVKDYLEIGTWRGESAANLAQVVENCFTINLPDHELRKLNMDELYIGSHRFFSKEYPNITHIQSHSHKFDFSSLGRKFDMVFIDGDHHYESVKKDTETAFNIIRDKNSVIVWHDYGYSPESVRWEVLMGILDGSPPKAHGKIFHISNTLCAVYMNGNYPASLAVKYALPDKCFSINIQLIN